VETRIQLCGPLDARIDGRRVEAELPGRQGRLLFAYLVLHRRRTVDREMIADLLWEPARPASAASAVSALLSKLRRSVGVDGRSELRLTLPSGAWVDVEVATAALHRAESAAGRGEWEAAWGPARVAQHVCERPFLPGETATWAVGTRNALQANLLHALELVGLAAVHIGGSELDTAERAARRRVDVAPLRASGTRQLMVDCEQRGNRAEGLVAYEALRVRLREELGVGPSPETVAVHRRLLDPAAPNL
jgi:DNA-binding SARP family transcriptional activator